MRRSLVMRRFAVLAGVTALAAGTLTLALPGVAGAAPVELFNQSEPGFYADAAVVPADICWVEISAAGGSGGNYVPIEGSSISGGSAASLSERVAVQPGDVLDALVARQGASVPLASPNTGHGGDGGFGGGGGGGGGTSGNRAGAGGGGASAVGLGSGAPLVVAGGGGGASPGTSGTGGNAGVPFSNASNGGGTNGGQGGQANGNGGAATTAGDGGAGGGVFTGPQNGGDGDGSAGGGGGQANNGGGAGGNVPGNGLASTIPLGGDGGGGEAPGGNGGDNSAVQTNGGGGGAGAVGIGGGGGGYSSGFANGGGGGGGYGGGAGGGAATNSSVGNGGGGGSSFRASQATPISESVGHTGNGFVTITYDPTADRCPWPILKVAKTIDEADDNGDGVDFPEGTEFTVRVTCEAPQDNNHINAAGFGPTFVTELTFDEDGSPESADPQDGWFKEGDFWVLQDKSLTFKLCVAEETDIESDDNGDNGNGAAVNEDDVEVAYKCEATATPVLNVIDNVQSELSNGVPFGCVRPLPEGEYDDDAEDAAVQFTSFWDSDACAQQAPASDVSAELARVRCQETGVLTVDNTWDPPEPEEVVVTPAPAPILVSPAFTG